jgi:hypothetical protein
LPDCILVVVEDTTGSMKPMSGQNPAAALLLFSNGAGSSRKGGVR